MKTETDVERIEKIKIRLCRCGRKAMPGRDRCRVCKER